MNDDVIKNKLEQIALKHRVETDSNCGRYIKDYTSYSVQISGFNIPLFGGNNKCKYIMERLSSKWTKIFGEENITDFKLTIDDLPM